ncbi:methionine synthase [Saxibacter everestensis]|uniref:Methionine synthase n=1 Tax=Saxibacter everestensis TaxID=2909229 RepID=A0ABY8QX25_9MICO|nr:methionine synthase [Brevibacteriaceae bacterium ZFBP1038]
MVTADGSWPGTDVREAHNIVFGELGAGVPVSESAYPMPFLPRLESRGPGADLAGYAAGLLVDLHVDMQPHGWRIVDHAGKDARRTAAIRNRDIDTLAEFAEGYAGPLGLTVLGPWSLTANLWLGRGERVVVDPGARRDVLQSYAEGVADFISRVRNAVPDADIVVRLEETALSHVLSGRLPTVSGFGRLPSVPEQHAQLGLRSVVKRLRTAGASTVAMRLAGSAEALEWQSADGPRSMIEFAAGADADAIAVDLPELNVARWESVARIVGSGTRLWAGIPSGESNPKTAVTAGVDAVRRPWRELGLPLMLLDDIVLMNAGSLAAGSVPAARRTLAGLVAVRRALSEAAHEG